LNDPRLISVPLSDIWHRSQLQEFQGCVATVLSPEDTLIYVANSLLTQDGQQLKYLGDIALLLKKYQDKLDWDYIIRSGSSLGIKTIIYYSLKWAQELLEAPAPSWVITTLKPKLGRRCLIKFIDQQSILSPIRWGKLRMETKVIVKSLRMSRIHQSLTVLSKYRADGKRVQWLRTIAWIPLVLSAALWSTAVKWANR
jgi:hypothetical protein